MPLALNSRPSPRQLLLHAIEEHRTYRDLVQVAFGVLTRLHRTTLTAALLGRFAGADTLLATSTASASNAAVTLSPLLAQYAFPEDEVGQSAANSYLDPGHAAAAPCALPAAISAARPLLCADCAGVSVYMYFLRT